mmetsp:Transcript_73640/g.225245  ORF Transcript_73640/g.225245 Transcript_73640/m.225245 type:complete len:277 (+) Transcript_73640:1183-2013(+)
MAPSNKKKGYSTNAGIPSKCASNMVSLPVPVGSIQPKVSAATTAAKKARTMVFCGNMVLTSSYEKSTPPSGVPKATATPAAAAVLMSSRRLASLSVYRAESLESALAQQQATCTKGPSLPKLMPEETDSVSPTTFTSNVLSSSTSPITKPPKIVFTSGMPLPRAAGAKAQTSAAEAAAKATPAAVYQTTPTYGCHAGAAMPDQLIQASPHDSFPAAKSAGHNPKRRPLTYAEATSTKLPDAAVNTPTAAGINHGTAANHVLSSHEPPDSTSLACSW